MKLHYSPGACALHVQIALREFDQKFEMVKVDIKNKQYAGGDYKEVNPKGYVPALELDNGVLLTEGAIILQRLADQHPEKNLLPKWGTEERYKAMEWLHFVSTELHKGFSGLFNPSLNEEARASIMAKLNTRLTFINEHLKTSQYFLGADFSVVDAYAYNMIRWARPLKVDLTPYPSVLAFVERVSQRPSVRESVQAEGLRL